MADFRQDFGLASPDLSKNPTIMDVLGKNNKNTHQLQYFKK